MRILSLYNAHDGGIALFEDGRFLHHCELERFFQLKHNSYPGYRNEAIFEVLYRYLQPVLGWDLDRVDVLCVNPIGQHCYDSTEFAPHQVWPIYGAGDMERPYTVWQDRWQGRERTFFASNHHVNHAADAYYTSPFDDALVLAYDGCGEYGVTTGLFRGKRERLTWETDFLHRPLGGWPSNKIGEVYSNLGLLFPFLGLDALDTAGKAMGLAAYGNVQDGWRAAVRKQLLHEEPIYHATFLFDHRGFLQEVGLDGADLNNPESSVARDLMATIQDEAEVLVCELVADMMHRYGQQPLCLGGGCAQNIGINSRLLREGVVDDLYVPPTCADRGQPIGSALYYWHHVLGNPFQGMPWRSPYAGEESYDDRNYWVLLLQFSGLSWCVYEDEAELLDVAAGLLAEDKILAWMQGRYEVGPRALGNRSLLASPARAWMKDKINATIKGREFWRPFAPSVLGEEGASWFADWRPCPYMLEEFRVLPDKAALIPAVVHVDGTARPQSVYAGQNDRFYRLLQHFHKKTGLPMLLNTSLNVRGKPMANHCEAVLRLLSQTGLDVAVIGNVVFSK